MKEIRRYNLAISKELYNQVKKAADAKNITVVELLRRFISLGLIAVNLNNEAGETLVIREGKKERQIQFL